MKYIKAHGVPREDSNFISFDCTISPHTGATMDLYKINGLLSFDTLEQTLYHLQVQPIRVSLAAFDQLYMIYKNSPEIEVYYESTNEYSVFLDYHAVVIIAVELHKGELIDVVRMSNG